MVKNPNLPHPFKGGCVSQTPFLYIAFERFNYLSPLSGLEFFLALFSYLHSMPFQFNINIFSTRKDYKMYAEKLVSPSTEKRFRVYDQERVFIIKKDLVINNSPWELIEGSWPGITRADLMDAVRQMGAGIERVGY